MLTLITAWYIFKSKFNINVYQSWINNFLTNVNNFNLVIYTNIESKYVIDPFIKDNTNIKVILLEIEDFYGYQYKDLWIKNHEKNHLLNSKVDWKVNMLWSEKIYFVKRTIDNNYFNNEWYGWCDIGYFRGTQYINKNWPNHEKIKLLDINKIYYAKVCNDVYLNNLSLLVANKNSIGLPSQPIPDNQVSIAGGFFLCAKNNINWWFENYYQLLELYFKNNYLVKDDQIIIINCILNYNDKFKLIVQENKNLDIWFAFSSYLQ